MRTYLETLKESLTSDDNELVTVKLTSDGRERLEKAIDLIEETVKEMEKPIRLVRRKNTEVTIEDSKGVTKTIDNRHVALSSVVFCRFMPFA